MTNTIKLTGTSKWKEALKYFDERWKYEPTGACYDEWAWSKDGSIICIASLHGYASWCQFRIMDDKEAVMFKLTFG